MGKDKTISMLLKIWVDLDGIKNFVSVCKKGLDVEIVTDNAEMRSVLAVVEKLLGEVIADIDETLDYLLFG